MEPTHYKNIYGYFDFQDIYTGAFNRYPAGNYLEIGTWLGKSTCYMGELIKNSTSRPTLYCVDTFLGEPNATDQQDIVKEEGGSIYWRFLCNMEEAEVLKYMVPIQMESASAATIFKDEYFDFIFLDAAHLYEDVRLDLNMWFPKLKKGGMFAGHDYYQGTEVKRAVDEFFDEKKLTIRIHGTTFYIET